MTLKILEQKPLLRTSYGTTNLMCHLSSWQQYNVQAEMCLCNAYTKLGKAERRNFRVKNLYHGDIKRKKMIEFLLSKVHQKPDDHSDLEFVGAIKEDEDLKDDTIATIVAAIRKSRSSPPRNLRILLPTYTSALSVICYCGYNFWCHKTWSNYSVYSFLAIFGNIFAADDDIATVKL
uniref:Uncharacterized protein n=1 Tax=Glossina palpalis gambiensis TaxID=67801 RepID=A0A1B0BBR2_9MUSC